MLLIPVWVQAQTEADRLLRGEILFSSLVGKPLDAVSRYNTERGYRHEQLTHGAVSATDALLALGLGDVVKQTIQNRSDDKNTRSFINRDAYELARFYHNSGQPTAALQVLDSIAGKSAGVSGTDLDFLRALIYMDLARFREAAELLYELPLYQRPNGYTQYNLALAQLQGGNEERGRATLESLGKLSTDDTDLLALRDLANIKLGYRYLQQGSLQQAKDSFSRVRLDGPFTNQALLGSGWTSFYLGRFERAIVAWSMLHEQQAINDTVIEAKMALPYAYSKLNAHGKAANLYAHAIELFEAETARLDSASEAIRKGRLVEAIVTTPTMPGDDWFTTVSRNSEHPEFFLPLLLANDEFRDQADTLHQLVQLKHRIRQGQISVAASSEFARLKQKNYADRLPASEKTLAEIDKAIRKLMPPPQQTDTKDESVKPINEIVVLQQTYDNYRKTHEATAAYAGRLPAFSRELADVAKQMRKLGKQMERAIVDTGKQVEATALATLDQKRGQLQRYHHKALFALAESYDFATGKRQ